MKISHANKYNKNDYDTSGGEPTKIVANVITFET